MDRPFWMPVLYQTQHHHLFFPGHIGNRVHLWLGKWFHLHHVRLSRVSLLWSNRTSVVSAWFSCVTWKFGGPPFSVAASRQNAEERRDPRQWLLHLANSEVTVSSEQAPDHRAALFISQRFAPIDRATEQSSNGLVKLSDWKVLKSIHTHIHTCTYVHK